MTRVHLGCSSSIWTLSWLEPLEWPQSASPKTKEPPTRARPQFLTSSIVIDNKLFLFHFTKFGAVPYMTMDKWYNVYECWGLGQKQRGGPLARLQRILRQRWVEAGEHYWDQEFSRWSADVNLWRTKNRLDLIVSRPEQVGCVYKKSPWLRSSWSSPILLLALSCSNDFCIQFCLKSRSLTQAITRSSGSVPLSIDFSLRIFLLLCKITFYSKKFIMYFRDDITIFTKLS